MDLFSQNIIYFDYYFLLLLFIFLQFKRPFTREETIRKTNKQKTENRKMG